MEIRPVKDIEFKEVHNLIKISAEADWKYWLPPSEVSRIVDVSLCVKKLKERARIGHFYVALISEKIVGCGAILPYIVDGKNVTDEFIIRNVFVDKQHSGKGIGKAIIEVLENDEFGKKAKRIEVPATIPAIPFYIKLGYSHKSGIKILKGNDILLEKHF